MRELTDFPWTDDDLQRALELRDKGGKTYSEIAQILGGGLTRNAVIGKLKRADAKAGRLKRASKSGTGKHLAGAAAVEEARRRSERARAAVADREVRGGVAASRDPSLGGFTRAQVAGISSRMPGLKLGRGHESAGPIDADSRVLKSRIWEPLPGAVPVSLMELAPLGCKWPVGDPMLPGAMFCGLHRITGDERYCAVHAEAARGSEQPPIAIRATARHPRRANPDYLEAAE